MAKQKHEAGVCEYDVHELMMRLQEEYPVLLRFWSRPLKRSIGRISMGYYVQVYDARGRSMGEDWRLQHSWPSNDHKTVWGLLYALLWRLQGMLDEEQHRRARDAQQAAPEELTPLEVYIAGGF